MSGHGCVKPDVSRHSGTCPGGIPGLGGPCIPGLGGPCIPGLGGPCIPCLGGPCIPGLGGPCMSAGFGSIITCPAGDPSWSSILKM
uniref:Uncharacterized protein n=1 Tax=Poecilia reticulata TaxID=8081 RepID=A0A3P9PE81_POERE